MRQEQPPTDNDYNDYNQYNPFLPAQAPDAPPPANAPTTAPVPPVPSASPTAIRASAASESPESPESPESAALWALRAIAAALPNCRTLRLLRYMPSHNGQNEQSAQQAPLQEIAALQRENAGLATAQPLEPSLMRTLAGHLEAAHAANPPPQSPIIIPLSGMSLVLCRNQREALRGVLVIAPDIASSVAGSASPDATLVRLLATQATFVLELDTAAEEQRRLAELVAEESRARDHFISFAAHELRSPLTSIKGYAQLLVRQARKTPLPDAMLRSVQSIEQQSVRMSEMLGEMLDASRILRGKLEMMPSTVDLAALVKKVVERRRTFFPEHDLIVIGADTPLVGRWDGVRIEQIVRDLLDNAVRHSPNDTAVVVELMRAPDHVTISIRDQGTGIPEHERSRIFGYLYRTPEAERRNLVGLGLGLFVSRHLAERLGGRLWLEASSIVPPSGSDFRFTLPLHANEQSGESHDASEFPPTPDPHSQPVADDTGH